METHSLRLRLLFEEPSVLSQPQRSEGMNNSWILIEPNQHPKISDVCNHLLHKLNLRRSCPNGIILSMEGYVLPLSEPTRIFKDNDIICVRRKGICVAEAIQEGDAGKLLDEEVNRRETVDSGMLLLENEEFDKETGGYRSESEDGEVGKVEEEASAEETTSKKRKASTKLKSSKKKKHRSQPVMNGVEAELATEDNNINNDECLPMKINSKKIKSSKEKKSGESETIIERVKSPPKVKRKKKHHLEVVGGDDEIVTNEVDQVNDGESLPQKKISKKKIKPNEETKRENAETSEEVEQMSSVPDGAEKVTSRSSRRKKSKRRWRRLELAKILQNPDTHVEPGVSNAEIKEANDHPLKQDPVPAKVVHKNIVEQEERNRNGAVDTELVPCVVRPGHIRFEPLDEDKDTTQTVLPDISFQWNGTTNKKKGQKWGLEKFSVFERDDSHIATKESSTMLTVDTQVPLVDHIDFDQLPLCSSPKAGDVIAYRVLELSSSWTPELSSFRVGKISYYDADNIILMPVPEYPIVFDKVDEDGPDNSLYKEDGSLEIKFEALADVRSVKQINSDAVKAVSNGINRTPQGDEKNAASKLMSNGNGVKKNLAKDPSPVVDNKKGNTWVEIDELLSAKKSELLETNQEMKKDAGWNKWSYRALRGSALGPTMALLRSSSNV